MLGGTTQKSLQTSTGWRRIDQLDPKSIARESKVGYVAYTQAIEKQAVKDAWLIANKDIKGAAWHFYQSPVTGKIGPSVTVAEQLRKHGISYFIHHPTYTSLHY